MMKESKDLALDKITASDRLSYAEGLYLLYPRKTGKAAGISKLTAMLTSFGVYKQVANSIENYKIYLKLKNTPPEYTLMFSTFINGRWQDYADDNYEYIKPQTDHYEEILKTVNLHFRFSRHLPRIKEIYPQPEAFKAFLASRKDFYTSTSSIDANLQKYRDFLAACINKQIGV